MNKNRRKRIENIVEKLKECSDNLSYIKDEEDESRDNVPEGLQSSETYSYSQECSEKWIMQYPK